MLERVIGEYIFSNSRNEYENIVSLDERLEVATYIGGLTAGMFGWYPFTKGSNILQVGSWFGAFSEILTRNDKNITIVESDFYRSFVTKNRFIDIPNIKVVNESILEFSKECEDKFDYVIYTQDEKIERIANKEEYTNMIEAIKKLLKENGKLLIALPNRFGVKYLCGNPDPATGRAFDGMTESNSKLYRFEREELIKFIKGFDFKNVKLYYPFPDHRTPQIIYTDNYKPDTTMRERLHVYIEGKTKRVLHEPLFMDFLLRNDVMPVFSNSFIVEATNGGVSNVVYSAISSEREKENAFATNILDNDTVCKVPLYSEGNKGLERLIGNTDELDRRGIPVVKIQDVDGIANMEYVKCPTLSSYIKNMACKNKEDLIKCIEKLKEYVISSSEHVSPEANIMKVENADIDWGVILKKAFIEMIPVNCFYNNGKFLFFDQEFFEENCPANYVLYRALRDIYAFCPEVKNVVSLEYFKEKYGLTETWEYFDRKEDSFQIKLRKRNVYCGFWPWIKNLDRVMMLNREKIEMSDKINEYDCFNVRSNLDNRRIILFGAGKMADKYLSKYGKEFTPDFILDNNRNMWGSFKNDIEIKSPEEVSKLMPGSFRIIIAVKNYEEIINQLGEMGIGADSYRIFDSELDELTLNRVTDSIIDGKYNIGYVTGAFDLFHIGHLNILKNSKSRCHYLIAGVLTDEIIIDEKHKKPFIPFEERIEIVKQCKYVDRVVAIDKHNTNKIDAWKELRYGCLFSGNDHENEPYWINLQKQLRSLGSELEFFPYTEGTSSTMLQNVIRTRPATQS